MNHPIRLPLDTPITDERALSYQIAKGASRLFDKWQAPCGFLRETQKGRLILETTIVIGGGQGKFSLVGWADLRCVNSCSSIRGSLKYFKLRYGTQHEWPFWLWSNLWRPYAWQGARSANVQDVGVP